MQPDVDDQARGAEQLRIQAAKILGRFVVEPELGAKALGVKRPAFSESRIVAETPETGQSFLLALNGNLEMVAGKGFVELVERSR